MCLSKTPDMPAAAATAPMQEAKVPVWLGTTPRRNAVGANGGTLLSQPAGNNGQATGGTTLLGG